MIDNFKKKRINKLSDEFNSDRSCLQISSKVSFHITAQIDFNWLDC